MTLSDQRKNTSMPGRTRVLILSGEFKGEEGIYLGEDEGGRCAVSPDRSDEVLSLKPDREFALLVDLSADPVRN
jgi:hypothetical protein